MSANNLNLNHITEKNKLFKLSINSTIKKTYMLLSFCICLSVVSAYVGIIANYNTGFIMFLAFAYGSIYVMQKNKDNYIGLASLFFLASFLGFSLGPMLNTIMFQHTNGASIIGVSFGATSITFFSLSVYAAVSKTNFNFLSGFLGIISCIIFSLFVVSLFINIPILQLTISGGIAIFSAGMILRTTNNLIYDRGERNSILIAASLFLDFYNLFISLLRIFSFLSGRK
jgi:modulator of FtsH protease